MKKILIVLLALTFVFAFAACDDNDTTSTESKADATSVASEAESSVVSEESSEASVAESSEESTEESAAEVSTGVVEGIYYGDGYSFTVPEGFTVLADEAGSVMFMDTTASVLTIMKTPNTTQLTTMTKEQFSSVFATMFEGVEFTSFESTTVDGVNAIYTEFNATISNMEYAYYMNIIFTGEYQISAFIASATDMSNTYTEMMTSFTID